ncbi:FadR/GntR family transcriptional regulator [Paenibacillus sp. GCM10027626]|uniref:FadR/GntR family transcriptional regulator n=1 Tax=Paenibacillus sp. GCM10027626 TaxID=3273411 RepID=UPI00363268EF
MLQKTTRLTLVEQAAMQMESLIETGHWAVGTRIPAEPELMAELNVSRNTLREAIKALTHAGLLKTRQGDGTYVCSASVLGVALQRRIQQSSTLRTLEVRHALEREAACLAATRRTDDEAALLQTLLETCASAMVKDDLQAYIAADIALHQAIVEASHNDILIELYGHIMEVMQASIELLADREKYSCHMELHRNLVEAIVAQHTEKAVIAVHSYIEAAKESFNEDWGESNE